MESVVGLHNMEAPTAFTRLPPTIIPPLSTSSHTEGRKKDVERPWKGGKSSREALRSSDAAKTCRPPLFIFTSFTDKIGMINISESLRPVESHTIPRFLSSESKRVYANGCIKGERGTSVFSGSHFSSFRRSLLDFLTPDAKSVPRPLRVSDSRRVRLSSSLFLENHGFNPNFPPLYASIALLAVYAALHPDSSIRR
uniref:Uncharacterized protein n=1 Tax=Vespula pensylvanica TaxID=30213 RepID=A0A834PAT5_VESPE|nr:hypothetical protein H0235_002769 [Vespula pensylvanica]